MPLTMLQDMAIHDEQGRCRCPICGRFRRREDFQDQPGSLRCGSALITVAPACRECLGHPLSQEPEAPKPKED